jgi:hypothetical protein
VLREIFGPQGQELTGGWTKPSDEKFYNLEARSSSSVIRIIKSRKMGGM